MLQIVPLPLFNPSSDRYKWETVKKTQSVFAKHVSAIVDTNNFQLTKLKLVTLEGDQVVSFNSMICEGSAREDPWPMPSDKFFDEYEVIDCAPDGWFICRPKASKPPVLAHEVVSNDFLDADFEQAWKTLNASPYGHVPNEAKRFKIYGKYGHKCFPDGADNPPKYEQLGEMGDYVLKSINDPSDVWIVKRKLYLSTYESGRHE